MIKFRLNWGVIVIFNAKEKIKDKIIIIKEGRQRWMDGFYAWARTSKNEFFSFFFGGK